MATSKSITGNADGKNGENQSYTINGRGAVSRAKLTRETDAGLHDGVHTVNVNGVKYVRANPNKKAKDNVDK
ncbi:DUF3892 domain-containing protein [Thalassotalea piscium]